MNAPYDHALIDAPPPLFTVGERAYGRRLDEDGNHERDVFGIITDCFFAPISGQYVYVIRGEGFYQDDLLPALPVPFDGATASRVTA